MNSQDTHKWIGSLRTEPSDRLDRRIDALVASLPAVTRTRVVRRRTARIALAAAALVVIGVVVQLFNSSQSNVWARALENTRNIGDYSYQFTTTHEATETYQTSAPGPTTGTCLVSEKYGSYSEAYVNGRLERKSYCLLQSNEFVEIFPQRKEYLRYSLDPIMLQNRPKEVAVWLLSGHCTELGRETVNGRVLAGLEYRRRRDLGDGTNHWETQAWFDMETMLPASIEYSFYSGSDGARGRTRQEGYVYGLDFPKDLFEPNIPEDYVPLVVGGLKLFSDMTGGKYPFRLDGHLMKCEIDRQAEDANTVAAVNAPADTVYGFKAFRYVENLSHTLKTEEAEFGYFGERVTAKDHDRVLLYWRWNGPRQDCYVIWGDLRAEVLPKPEFVERVCAVNHCDVLAHLAESEDDDVVSVIANYGRSDGDTRALIPGRVVYANGKRASHTMMRIADERVWATRQGYFVASVSPEDPNRYYTGYASNGKTQTSLFFWRKADPPGRLTVVLDWAAKIAGRVVDEKGRPCRGIDARVYAHPQGHPEQSRVLKYRVRTDYDGRFVLKEMPSGFPLELVVRDPNDDNRMTRLPIGKLDPDGSYDVGRILLNQVSP